MISGRDEQKCRVSHLFLGRPDWSESSENLQLVSAPLSHVQLYPPTSSPKRAAAVVLSYHCHLYPHPENDEERADVLDNLKTRIQDLNNVRTRPSADCRGTFTFS